MKNLLAAALIALGIPSFADPDPADWDAVLAEAEGQTVYWHAWGGSPQINDFIAWLGDEVQVRYGVTVEHVKLTDTADAVGRVVAERSPDKGADERY